ncbi:hypothetical protein BS78_07G208200 [Paspalum vaginatum]|nr:hypothetical protein BS78_07G208200 [Paspalum vaginatum]
MHVVVCKSLLRSRVARSHVPKQCKKRCPSFPEPPATRSPSKIRDLIPPRPPGARRSTHVSLARRPGTRSVSASPTLSTYISRRPLSLSRRSCKPHTRTHPPTIGALTQALSPPGRPMAATAVVAASLSVAPRGLGGKPLISSGCGNRSAAASLRVPSYSPRRSVVVRASSAQQGHPAAREWAGAAAVAAALVLPEVAEAAAPGLSPSLKNFLLSIVSGGVVLVAIVGAVVAVSNFDPVKRG